MQSLHVKENVSECELLTLASKSSSRRNYGLVSKIQKLSSPSHLDTPRFYLTRTHSLPVNSTHTQPQSLSHPHSLCHADSYSLSPILFTPPPFSQMKYFYCQQRQSVQLSALRSSGRSTSTAFPSFSLVTNFFLLSHSPLSSLSLSLSRSLLSVYADWLKSCISRVNVAKKDL